MRAVFKDETVDVLLLDEIAVRLCCAVRAVPRGFGLQMPALDPSRYWIEAPVVFERHPFQLKMDPGHGTGVPRGF